MTAAAPLPLRPPFSFTYHAVSRFRERVWPSINPGRPCADAREALSILSDAAARAELSTRRTDRDHAVWIVRDPEMRWITRPGEFRGRRVAVVVTVLTGSESAEAEEQAERDVIEAARRLAAVPALGTEEATSPPPADLQGFALKAYRAWISLETQRLSVERDRLRKLKAVTADQSAPKPRATLFIELVRRLEVVDAEGSAELIARARERVAKWEAEGKRLTEETT